VGYNFPKFQSLFAQNQLFSIKSLVLNETNHERFAWRTTNHGKNVYRPWFVVRQAKRSWFVLKFYT